MATRLSVNINTGNNKNDGETRSSECQNIADVLNKMSTMVRNTQASGTVYDRNGLAHTYTYTPTATS